MPLKTLKKCACPSCGINWPLFGKEKSRCSSERKYPTRHKWGRNPSSICLLLFLLWGPSFCFLVCVCLSFLSTLACPLSWHLYYACDTIVGVDPCLLHLV
jgi:hypothetical protein